MAITWKALFKLLCIRHPRALQVAQHWLEIFPIVPLFVITIFPRLEPLSHFGYLAVNTCFSSAACKLFRSKGFASWQRACSSSNLQDFRRYIGERYILDFVEAGLAMSRKRSMRHFQTVVIVSGTKFNAVQYGDEFSHTNLRSENST